MRVFMTADAVGGVWTYARDLAQGLAARGEEVTLAVLGPPPSPAQRADAGRIPGVDLVETGLPLDWTAADPQALSDAARALADLAAERRPHVVHLNSPALAGFATFPAPVVGVAHSCLATWWRAVKGGEPPDDFRWRIEATARGYAACTALIAPSASFAAATATIYGEAPYVVRNGRHAASTPIGGRDVEVIAAGRLWDEGKGMATLDAAAALLPEVAVEALGSATGPQGQGVALPQLHLAGPAPAETVARRFARARVFVSPSLYEPFGLSTLEAAQAGCALVLSDIPTHRELWNGAAVFTAPGDAPALAAALRALLADEPERARLAAAARIRAGRYDLDSFVEGVAALHRAAARPCGVVRGAA